MALGAFRARTFDGTRQVLYGDGPPANAADGSFNPGDKVENVAPGIGQPPGWICTVAGSPGTWRPDLGGLIPTTTKTAAYAFDPKNDMAVVLSTGGGTVALTLPDPATCPGSIVMVSRAGANNGTVTAGAGKLAGANTTLTLSTDSAGATLFSDGTLWRISGAFGTAALS